MAGIKHKPLQTDTYIVGSGGWTPHRFAKLSANNTAVLATANSQVLGTTDVAESATAMGEIHLSGIVSVYAGDTVTYGEDVKSDANGAAVPVVAGGTAQNSAGVCIIGGAAGELISIVLRQGGRKMVDCISQTFEWDDMVDGGAAVATLALTDKLPLGAIVLGWKAVVTEDFSGADGLVMTVGDGTDADRFNGAADPDIDALGTFVCSPLDGDGIAICDAETTITVTLTEGSEWGDVITGATGIVDFELYYIATV